LVGGGLIRSLGGWSEVLSLRRRGEKTVSDERILGSGEFIEQLLSEAEEKAKETLGWRGRVPRLQTLLSKISKRDGVEEEKVREKGDVVENMHLGFEWFLVEESHALSSQIRIFPS